MQTLAIAADAVAQTELDLALLWRDLARGTCRVLEDFFSEVRCYLVLSNDPGPTHEPIEGRRLDIVEAVLCGKRQKNIALELGLAASTVALNARLALETIGVNGRPSRTHPILMLAARAAGESMRLPARSSRIATPGGELSVVSLPRPDLWLERHLPAAELSVIQSLFEGNTYEEIARARDTSTRTVANQISAVFRRLRVSGRNELVQRLFLADEGLGASPAPPRETLAPPSPDAADSRARRSA